MIMKSRLMSALVCLALGATLVAQSNEDLPRRQFESGLAFLKGQRYAEALKDFQAIIDSFPRSLVADNAMLQIAQYQIDVAHDLGAAKSAVDQLLKIYPETDSAPMAYVVGGRIAMEQGRTPSDVDSAVASFERVERLCVAAPVEWGNGRCPPRPATVRRRLQILHLRRVSLGELKRDFLAGRFKDLEETRDLRRTSLKGVGLEVTARPMAAA